MEKPTQKRKTITISYELFEAVSKVRQPENRLEIYETMFSYLFKNKPIEYSKIKSDTVSSILAYMMPDIRKIQSKFENGNTKKGTKNTASLFCCSQASSELQANISEENASDYNIYNTINNLFLIINQSVNHNKKYNSYINITNKDYITDSLKKICQKNENHYKIVTKVLNELCGKEKIKINGVWVEQAEALDTIVGLLTSEDGIEQLSLKIDEVAQAQGLKNKLGYLTTALFNLSKNLKNKNVHSGYTRANTSYNANSDIISHNYTAEQLKSVYDNLDDFD